MLTDFQRAKIARFFELLDRDANGRMEIDDMIHVADELCAHRGWSPESPEGRTLYGAYENWWHDVREFANGDSVPLEGFLEYHARLLPRPGAYDDSLGRIVGLLFSTLDADDDGRITLDEHRTFCGIFGFDPSLADSVFPRWDSDGDGFVSLDELGVVVHGFFHASDAEAPGNWLFGPMSSSVAELRSPA
jgi:hypothetical protein